MVATRFTRSVNRGERFRSTAIWSSVRNHGHAFDPQTGLSRGRSGVDVWRARDPRGRIGLSRIRTVHANGRNSRPLAADDGARFRCDPRLRDRAVAIGPGACSIQTTARARRHDLGVVAEARVRSRDRPHRERGQDAGPWKRIGRRQGVRRGPGVVGTEAGDSAQGPAIRRATGRAADVTYSAARNRGPFRPCPHISKARFRPRNGPLEAPPRTAAYGPRRRLRSDYSR